MKAFLFVLVFIFTPTASKADDLSAVDKVKEVGLSTVLGSQVDLSLEFRDSDGNTKTIKDFMLPSKPLVLVPMYYRCPGLCGITLQSALALVNDLSAKLGDDYSILTISFNPKEGPELAKGKAATTYTKLLDEEAGKRGWHFSVGDQENITKLLSQIGYRLVPDGEDFSHASAIFVLTPEGKISQYFSGVMFPTWDVKLALVEASEGAVGSLLHQAVLFCFSFDPAKGKYTMTAMKVMRVGGILTLLGILIFWLLLVRRKKLLS